MRPQPTQSPLTRHRPDEPLVWYEGSGTSDRRWPIADERGSVMGIANDSGVVTALNSYDAFGAPASGNVGRFGYTGQIWLPEAGLWHYKARAYHPGLGRFLQTDPIGTAGGLNLYGYAGNDPVNGRDPSGLCDLGTDWGNDRCPPMPKYDFCLSDGGHGHTNFTCWNTAAYGFAAASASLQLGGGGVYTGFGHYPGADGGSAGGSGSPSADATCSSDAVGQDLLEEAFLIAQEHNYVPQGVSVSQFRYLPWYKGDHGLTVPNADLATVFAETGMRTRIIPAPNQLFSKFYQSALEGSSTRGNLLYSLQNDMVVALDSQYFNALEMALFVMGHEGGHMFDLLKTGSSSDENPNLARLNARGYQLVEICRSGGS